MGRTVNAGRLVSAMEAATEPKRQLRIILEVLAGRRSIAEACEELSIGEATFHRLRDQALQAALEGLAPRPPGRPARAIDPKDQRIRELEERIDELGIDLEAERVRTIIAIVKPELLKERGQKKSLPPLKSPSSQELFPGGNDTRPS